MKQKPNTPGLVLGSVGGWLFLRVHVGSLSGCYGALGASRVVLVVKNLPANAGDVKDIGLILGPGRFFGVGNGKPL